MAMIRLVDLLRIQNVTLGRYKIHLATGGKQEDRTPLQAFVAGDFKEWQERQTQKNFGCERVLSLIHLSADRWLFAGVYGILGVEQTEDKTFRYSTELLLGQGDLVGRVIVRYRRDARASYIWGEKHENKLEVAEILDSAMSIEPFPGYNRVLLSNADLKVLFRKDEPSWKAALSSVGGVYLIVNTINGKPYVGSAYGGCGLWQRWRDYAETGHGENVKLRALFAEHGEDYAANFQYSILEIADLQATQEQVCARESHWKKVLLSREFGYNDN